jgi:MSHA biogenesis protein MshP
MFLIYRLTVKSNKKIKYKSQKQQGSAIVLAIFVMVVVMLLGSTLMQILSTSNENIAQEVLGTRAFAAANSGMQAQLEKLFPLDNAAGVCPSAATTYDFSTINGLNHCQASVTCTNYATNNSVKYYRLKSTGTCGTGTMAANSDGIVLSSRTVQVEARDL